MALKTGRLELAGPSTARDDDYDTDRHFINCYPEKVENGEIYITKRPGHSTASYDVSGDLTSETPRGCFSWKGDIWHAWGSKLFRNTTEITGPGASGDALDQSTGKVAWAVSNDNALLYIHEYATDSTNNMIHSIATAGTEVLSALDTDFLAWNTYPGIEVLDGFSTILTSLGIQHTSLNGNPAAADGTVWVADNTIVPNLIGFEPVAITRHVNYLVYLGEKSIEFFQDAGNASGSVYSKLKGTGQLIGCAAPDSVAQVERTVFWIAQGNGGGRFVCALEGLQPVSVSTGPVELALDAEGDITDAYGYHFRIDAHSFYCIHLPGQDQTWVYDITEGVWVQFRTGTSGGWHVYDATATTGSVYVQDSVAGSGFIYKLDLGQYKDNATDISVEGHTNRWDGGTAVNKFVNRLTVIGNKTASTASLDISWSDDDYGTFVTDRTSTTDPSLDLTNELPHITRLGRTKRRSFRYKYSANLPLRIKAFELRYHTADQYGT